MSVAVQCDGLGKTYLVPVREPGLRQALRSLIWRQTRPVHAVADVSIAIAEGEVVGFLGPNGAGKTTTLKMLSGLLHPSAGSARVLGFEPWRRDRAFLRQITLVMGQRNQLLWDIPVLDSFERNRVIYDIGGADYRARVDELTELLDLADLLQKPVRNLSLGERMKCEFAAALLHRPRMLFLDEPTIGVDVTMQRRLRAFIADYNRRTGATVLLTSHYMADVTALCQRVIVIHQGQVRFDGALSKLVARFTAHKTINLQIEASESPPSALDFATFGTLVAQGVAQDAGQSGRFSLRVRRQDAARVTSELLSRFAIADLTVEDPPIEDVIDQVFAEPLA